MDISVIRALIALLLAVVFWMQARGVRDQPKRKRAFELLGGASLAFAALLGLAAAGVADTLLTIAVLAVAFALMIAAIFSLLASFSGGEMRGRSARGPLPGRLLCAVAEWRARELLEAAGFSAVERAARSRGEWLWLRARRAPTLPDFVRPGLDLLICGRLRVTIRDLPDKAIASTM